MNEREIGSLHGESLEEKASRRNKDNITPKSSDLEKFLRSCAHISNLNSQSITDEFSSVESSQWIWIRVFI